MSNEERMKRLAKHIDTMLPYTTVLPSKKPQKVDIAAAKKLAKQIRKTVWDYTDETTAHADSGNRLTR